MPLSYTADQLTREVQLLISEVALLADLVIDEGAGVRALGVAAESDFAQTRHPDDIADLSKYDVWQHIVRIEQYVQQQQWSDQLRDDILWTRKIVERVFSPTVLREYEEDRLQHPEEKPIPGAWEKGASDISLAYFHNGILSELASLAAARFKADTGERLTMGEIAQLLDVREATVVTNAHRKNFVSVEEDNRRYAEPADVLPWMVKNGYRPTAKDANATESEPQLKTADKDNMLFVPVARDGTWFSPETSSGGRYTIGAKGEERKFVDYFEALKELVRMPTPRWRRKNTNGIPGIVSGVRFDRIQRAELDRALAKLSKRT
jgi:hypothetical protein